MYNIRKSHNVDLYFCQLKQVYLYVFCANHSILPKKNNTVNRATVSDERTHLLDDYSNSSICLSINSTYTDGKKIKDIYIYIYYLSI